MAKFTTLCILALLLCSTLTYAARPAPTTASRGETAVEGFGEGRGDKEAEERCEGVAEEECLIRRTLVAHTDYIYTQNHNP
ncbi:PREDICTED: phytosulfokines 3-like [Tarenaya hassleriana]|uniref:phytosulfokines 3-like n=1 Tax=Tarenaya hassleriana TaxID=28532 RepID=UPI0008FD13EF|nr:PREDICTED: phytosulfokines 3-like [Tarenaya hassleriana]